MFTKSRKLLTLATMLGAISLGSAIISDTRVETNAFIVQGTDLAAVQLAVEAVGGTVTHELGVIKALGVELTESQTQRLRDNASIRRVYADRTAEVAGKPSPETFYPSQIQADKLHALGITGAGVGVAVIDTGIWAHVKLNKDSAGNWRHVAQYDAITDTVLGSLPVAEIAPGSSGMGISTNDDYGHGAHVSSIAVSSVVTRWTRCRRSATPR